MQAESYVEHDSPVDAPDKMVNGDTLFGKYTGNFGSAVPTTYVQVCTSDISISSSSPPTDTSPVPYYLSGMIAYVCAHVKRDKKHRSGLPERTPPPDT